MPERTIVWPKNNWEVLQLAGRVLPGVIANVALGLVLGEVAMAKGCGGGGKKVDAPSCGDFSGRYFQPKLPTE